MLWALISSQKPCHDWEDEHCCPYFAARDVALSVQTTLKWRLGWNLKICHFNHMPFRKRVINNHTRGHSSGPYSCARPSGLWLGLSESTETTCSWTTHLQWHWTHVKNLGCGVRKPNPSLTAYQLCDLEWASWCFWASISLSDRNWRKENWYGQPCCLQIYLPRSCLLWSEVGGHRHREEPGQAAIWPPTSLEMVKISPLDEDCKQLIWVLVMEQSWTRKRF